MAPGAQAQIYLEAAASNRFTTESLGCSISISDGAHGTEYFRVENLVYLLLKKGYMARGVFSSRDMVAVDIAALDLADKAQGKLSSLAEEKEVNDLAPRSSRAQSA